MGIRQHRRRGRDGRRARRLVRRDGAVAGIHFGLPVPHTAIIPRRKAEIGRNLQDFVTENFLTEAIARERLAAAQVGARAGRWLGERAHRDRVMADEVVRVAGAGLGRLSDDEVRSLVGDVLLPRLTAEPISPIAGTLLDGIVADQSHRGLVRPRPRAAA